VGITWIVGENDFLVSRNVRDAIYEHRLFGPEAVVSEIDKPRTKAAVMRALTSGGFESTLYIIHDVHALRSWETLGPDIAATGQRVVITTQRPVSELKEKVYSKLKKAADSVSNCPRVTNHIQTTFQYLQDRAAERYVTLGAEGLWYLFACTGTDPWRIDRELWKLSFLPEGWTPQDAREVMWVCPEKALNLKALIYGKYQEFFSSAADVPLWEVHWRVAAFLLRFLGHHIYLRERKTLQGRVSGVAANTVRADMRRLPIPHIERGLRMLAESIPELKIVESRALLFAGIYRWAQGAA